MHKTQSEANYPVHLNYLSATILKNAPMGLPDRQLTYFGFGKPIVTYQSLDLTVTTTVMLRYEHFLPIATH